MKYTITIHKEQFDKLVQSLSNTEGREAAAYLFCSKSITKDEVKFVVNDLDVVSANDVLGSTTESISILSKSYVKAFAKADRENKSLFFVHSHPKGSRNFSKQDNVEESEIFRTGFIRSPKNLHGSLIVEGVSNPFLLGRVWLNEKKFVQLERVRVIGKSLRIFFPEPSFTVPPWANRQIEAFGKDFQRLLKRLCIGVVGAGGTGSSVCEQLIRMGIGELLVIDEQKLEDTNVTRVYGSGLGDVGKSKSLLIKKIAKKVGTGVVVNSINGSICDLKIAKKLRKCDLIFSCTDDMLGRTILNRLALYYYIPVIDVAVSVDSKNGEIKDITGRVTTLMAGNACLTCRGRINQATLNAEALNRVIPAEYEKQVKERYVPELAEKDPSIIMFTTNIASRAIIEFVSMLTGLMGSDWTATEIIERYHETDFSIRSGKNSSSGLEGCICGDKTKWGKGDTPKFLDRVW